MDSLIATFSPKLVRLFLPSLLLLTLIPTSLTTDVFTPRLGFRWETSAGDKLIEALFKDYKTFYYNQTLDHFNYRPESYTTFPQRYLINSKYWGGAKSSSPIFVYLGAEATVTMEAPAVGFLVDHAPLFKALLVHIEHRYFGESVPFGSLETAFSNTSTLGYFTATQALADYAEVIVSLKRSMAAESCPVFVFGGSYGGMLAAWFRLKYPHVAMGALASSAPLLYFEELVPWDQYYITATKDYKDTSLNCLNTIKQSWSEFGKIVTQKNGLSWLSKKFNTCMPLNNTEDLVSYLSNTITKAAQYDAPPEYPVKDICEKIDRFSKKTTNILSRIAAIFPKETCLNLTSDDDGVDADMLGWLWLRCTDVLFPIGVQHNDTIVPEDPFSYEKHTKTCRDLFGDTFTLREHWTLTEFGGRDIKHVLRKFGSNIIFSNGLRDTWSGAGVLQNISDSVVAVVSEKGSHCLELHFKSKTDPKWLVDMRTTEVTLMKRWISEYYQMYKAGKH